MSVYVLRLRGLIGARAEEHTDPSRLEEYSEEAAGVDARVRGEVGQYSSCDDEQGPSGMGA